MLALWRQTFAAVLALMLLTPRSRQQVTKTL
jgi:hypothetical protein